tara:strand:- start:21138 stop:21251 length:114 start_codon:yes stop_codon:yes gene_type:complete
MEILKAADRPNRAPEFQSSHPDPENRIYKKLQKQKAS